MRMEFLPVPRRSNTAAGQGNGLALILCLFTALHLRIVNKVTVSAMGRQGGRAK